MTKIYVTRHGETKWNTERRMQGHKDSPLTEMGIKQSKWLAERLKEHRFDHIYSSPSGRAYETAKLINQHQNLEITQIESLKEINLGCWEGLLVEEIQAFDEERYQNFWYHPENFVPTDGEGFLDVVNRCSETLEKIAEAHQGETILIVTHAVVLKSLIAFIEKKEIKDFWTGPFMNSTCLNCFEIDEEGWKITLIGDTSHYPEDIEPRWVHPR